MNSRRAFLLRSSTAIAGFAFVPFGHAALRGDVDGGYPSAAMMSYGMLAAQTNTYFRVQHPSGQIINLKLLKAPLARHGNDAGYKQFSLIFAGPKEVILEPAVYRFQHDQLGRFEMHIGGIGVPDELGVRYEAVFNQHIPRSGAMTRPA